MGRCNLQSKSVCACFALSSSNKNRTTIRGASPCIVGRLRALLSTCACAIPTCHVPLRFNHYACCLERTSGRRSAQGCVQVCTTPTHVAHASWDLKLVNLHFTPW